MHQLDRPSAQGKFQVTFSYSLLIALPAKLKYLLSDSISNISRYTVQSDELASKNVDRISLGRT